MKKVSASNAGGSYLKRCASRETEDKKFELFNNNVKVDFESKDSVGPEVSS